MRASAWGGAETRYFYALTPDRILDAVEAGGLPCTGRCMALNSMENRVYQVEVELEADGDRGERLCQRIVKFYRPGRWSKQQILDEHTFLLELVEHEIPVVAPLSLGSGSTLAKLDDLDIFFAVFPRVGGRAPSELDGEQARRIGRLVARIHNVGAAGEAASRVRLDPAGYGRDNLGYLLDTDSVPAGLREHYRSAVESLCDLVEPWFDSVTYQRIHGDCHLGNVLWGDAGVFLVDFDDMLRGPCVQDLWLLAPGRDAEAAACLGSLLDGYEEFREFDRRSLRLIEPLRALRYIHFTAWIARRWEDPAFKRVFSDFGSERYWYEQVSNLREQLGLIQESQWN